MKRKSWLWEHMVGEGEASGSKGAGRWVLVGDRLVHREVRRP